MQWCLILPTLLLLRTTVMSQDTQTNKDLATLQREVLSGFSDMRVSLKDLEDAAAKKGLLKPASDLEKVIAVLKPALQKSSDAVETIGKTLASGQASRGVNQTVGQAGQTLKSVLDETAKLLPLLKDIPDSRTAREKYQRAFDTVLVSGLALLTNARLNGEDAKGKSLIAKNATNPDVKSTNPDVKSSNPDVKSTNPNVKSTNVTQNLSFSQLSPTTGTFFQEPSTPPPTGGGNGKAIADSDPTGNGPSTLAKASRATRKAAWPAMTSVLFVSLCWNFN